jgi:hypothetical protein
MPPPEVAGEDDFDAYTAWLAEYLYALDVPIATRQQVLVEKGINGASSCAIIPLAMNIGWALDDLNTICDAVNDGQTYDQFIAAQINLWRECDEADPQYLDNWKIAPEIFARIAEEESERRATGLDFPMLDMPWRGPISHALKRIEDPNERLESVRNFFHEIQDARTE